MINVMALEPGENIQVRLAGDNPVIAASDSNIVLILDTSNTYDEVAYSIRHGNYSILSYRQDYATGSLVMNAGVLSNGGTAELVFQTPSSNKTEYETRLRLGQDTLEIGVGVSVTQGLNVLNTLTANTYCNLPLASDTVYGISKFGSNLVDASNMTDDNRSNILTTYSVVTPIDKRLAALEDLDLETEPWLIDLVPTSNIANTMYDANAFSTSNPQVPFLGTNRSNADLKMMFGLGVGPIPTELLSNVRSNPAYIADSNYSNCAGIVATKNSVYTSNATALVLQSANDKVSLTSTEFNSDTIVSSPVALNVGDQIAVSREIVSDNRFPSTTPTSSIYFDPSHGVRLGMSSSTFTGASVGWKAFAGQQWQSASTKYDQITGIANNTASATTLQSTDVIYGEYLSLDINPGMYIAGFELGANENDFDTAFDSFILVGSTTTSGDDWEVIKAYGSQGSRLYAAAQNSTFLTYIIPSTTLYRRFRFIITGSYPDNGNTFTKVQLLNFIGSSIRPVPVGMFTVDDRTAITVGGWVGISTLEPQYPLDVDGEARFRDRLITDGMLQINGGLQISGGKISINPPLTTTDLIVTGRLVSIYDAEFMNVTVQDIFVRNSLVLQDGFMNTSNLIAAADATVTANLWVNGNIISRTDALLSNIDSIGLTKSVISSICNLDTNTAVISNAIISNIDCLSGEICNLTVSNLDVTGILSISNFSLDTITVNHDLLVSNDLFVDGDLSLVGDIVTPLRVTSESVYGTLDVQGLTSIGSNGMIVYDVSHNVVISNGLVSATNTIEAKNDLTVSSNFTVNGSSTVSNMTLSALLLAEDIAVFKHDVTIDSNLNINTGLNVPMLTSSNMMCHDDCTIGQSLVVGSNLEVVRDLNVSNDTHIICNLDVNGDVTTPGRYIFTSNLTLQGDTSSFAVLEGKLSGDSIIRGDGAENVIVRMLYAGSENGIDVGYDGSSSYIDTSILELRTSNIPRILVREEGDTTFNCNVDFASNITVTNDLYVNRNVRIENDVYIAGTTAIERDTTFTSNVNVLGSTTSTRHLSVLGSPLDISAYSQPGTFVETDSVSNTSMWKNRVIGVDDNRIAHSFGTVTTDGGYTSKAYINQGGLTAFGYSDMSNITATVNVKGTVHCEDSNDSTRCIDIVPNGDDVPTIYFTDPLREDGAEISVNGTSVLSLGNDSNGDSIRVKNNARILGDNVRIGTGSQLTLSSSGNIQYTTDGVSNFDCITFLDCNVILKWDNGAKLQTIETGVKITGNNECDTLTVNSNTKLIGALETCDDATFNSNIAANDITVSDTLLVGGDSTVLGDATISGSLTCSNHSCVSATVDERMSVSNLYVGSNASGNYDTSSILHVKAFSNVSSIIRAESSVSAMYVDVAEDIDYMYINYVNTTPSLAAQTRVNNTSVCTYTPTLQTVTTPVIHCNNVETKGLTIVEDIALNQSILLGNSATISTTTSNGSINLQHNCNIPDYIGYSINNSVGFVIDPDDSSYGLVSDGVWSVRRDTANSTTELYHSGNVWKLRTRADGVIVDGKIFGSDWISSSLSNADTQVASSTSLVSTVYNKLVTLSNDISSGDVTSVMNLDRMTVPVINHSNAMVIRSATSVDSSNMTKFYAGGGVSVVGQLPTNERTTNSNAIVRFSAYESIPSVLTSSTGCIEIGVVDGSAPYVAAGYTAENIAQPLSLRTSNTDRIVVSSGGEVFMKTSTVMPVSPSVAVKSSEGANRFVFNVDGDTVYHSGNNHVFRVDTVQYCQIGSVISLFSPTKLSTTATIASTIYRPTMVNNDSVRLQIGIDDSTAGVLSYNKLLLGDEIQLGNVSDRDILRITNSFNIISKGSLEASTYVYSRGSSSGIHASKLLPNNTRTVSEVVTNTDYGIYYTQNRFADTSTWENDTIPYKVTFSSGRVSINNAYFDKFSTVIPSLTCTNITATDGSGIDNLNASYVSGSLTNSTKFKTLQWFSSSDNKERIYYNGNDAFYKADTVHIRNDLNQDIIVTSQQIGFANIQMNPYTEYKVQFRDASWDYLISGSDNIPRLLLDATGNLSVSGTVTAQRTNWTSDRRLKEDIIDIDDGMSVINRLRPKKYTMSGKSESGFVAQDIYNEIPELHHMVTMSDDADPSSDYWGSDSMTLSYVSLIPYLVKALQERDRTIDSMNERLAKLERYIQSTL